MVEEQERYGNPKGTWTIENVATETQRVVNDYMKLAYSYYKDWKSTYGLPSRTVTNYLKTVLPASTYGLIDTVNNWWTEQIELTERNVEKWFELSESTKTTTSSRRK